MVISALLLFVPQVNSMVLVSRFEKAELWCYHFLLYHVVEAVKKCSSAVKRAGVPVSRI
jgi:hypothetical protein